MKRFSKMLVLGLSAALVFGMTAQAAESPSADDAPATAEAAKNEVSFGDENGSTKVVIDGEEVEVEIEAPTALEETKYEEVKADVKKPDVVTKVHNEIKKVIESSVDNLKAMLPPNLKEQASGKTVKMKGEPKVTAAFNLEAPKGLTPEQIAKGVKIPFTLKKVKENVIYSIIHYLSDGTMEVLPATVEGGTIFATFTSFSPVVIVEQEIELVPVGEDEPDNSNGDGNSALPNNGGNTNSSNDKDPSVSPPTGEAVPVAAVMAVVLMAGAVLCAKKVRYNR